MNVFAYGTLMVPLIFEKIAGRNYFAHEAVLHDYARFRIMDASYPGIVGQEGGNTQGIVYTGLDTDSIARLDMFEGKRYARVEVTVVLRNNRAMPAQTYVIRDAFRHLLTDQPWCLKTFIENEQDLFIRSFSGFDRCPDFTDREE